MWSAYPALTEGQLLHRKTSCFTQNEKIYVSADCKVPSALYTHTQGYPPAARSCSHIYRDRDRVRYIHMVINLRQWQRHIWDKFKACIIPLNFWCMGEWAFPPCSRTLLSMGREWGGETFSEVLSGDGPRAAWGTQLLFLSVNSWQGGKGDFSWCSYPQLLGTSENHWAPHKSKHRRRKNNLRLFQMWKDGSKQGNRDQKQVSHSLRDEGVFIQAFFWKEHAKGNSPFIPSGI